MKWVGHALPPRCSVTIDEKHKNTQRSSDPQQVASAGKKSFSCSSFPQKLMQSSTETTSESLKLKKKNSQDQVTCSSTLCDLRSRIASCWWTVLPYQLPSNPPCSNFGTRGHTWRTCTWSCQIFPFGYLVPSQGLQFCFILHLRCNSFTIISRHYTDTLDGRHGRPQSGLQIAG